MNYLTCLLLLPLSCASVFAQQAFSQPANTQGLRLIKDEHQRVVAVEYYGSSGLRKAELHEFPHLKGVFIVYGTELSSDDITYLSTLKNVTELEMGGVLVDEYVTIEGGLSKLADLKSLETLFLCKQKMKDEDLEFVASLPRITYLEFIANSRSLPCGNQP